MATHKQLSHIEKAFSDYQKGLICYDEYRRLTGEILAGESRYCPKSCLGESYSCVVEFNKNCKNFETCRQKYNWEAKK